MIRHPQSPPHAPHPPRALASAMSGCSKPQALVSSSRASGVPLEVTQFLKGHASCPEPPHTRGRRPVF